MRPLDAGIRFAAALALGIVIATSLARTRVHLTHSARQSTALAGGSMPSFDDIGSKLGIDLIPATQLTYGPNLGDYDADSRLDLLFQNHSDPVTLIQQQSDSQLVDTTAAAGIVSDGDTHGAAWGDCDNDGQLDLYQTMGAERGTITKTNRLYHNLGNGTFVDVTEDAGVADPLGRGRSASWVDYDNDGDLDLFVTNEERTAAHDQLFSNNGACTFSNVSKQVGDLTTGFYDGAAWADYDNDGDMDVFVTHWRGVGLYSNNGAGAFSDRTSSVGINDEKKVSGIAWGDYDNDGDLDLYVTRSYDPVVDSVIASTDVLSVTGKRTSGLDYEDGFDFHTAADYIEFNLHFPFAQTCDTSQRALIHVGPLGKPPPVTTSAEMCEFSVSSGNYGAPSYTPGVDHGLYIWQSTPGAWHVRWTVPVDAAPRTYVGIVTSSQPITGVALFEPEYPERDLKNRLYRNNGDGTFVQLAELAGVQHNLNSTDAMWADFNNDGYLDLYVVNAGDSQIGNQPNFLYLNKGDGTFQETAVAVGASGASQGLGANAAVGDLNADGFIDIVVQNGLNHTTRFNGPRQMLLNEGNDAHWLQIRLVGQASNRLGIGARVEVTTPNGLYQLREMNGGIHGSSQDEMLLSFGLGENERATYVTIYWPSGRVQRLTDVEADQRIVAKELSSIKSFLPLIWCRP